MYIVLYQNDIISQKSEDVFCLFCCVYHGINLNNPIKTLKCSYFLLKGSVISIYWCGIAPLKTPSGKDTAAQMPNLGSYSWFEHPFPHTTAALLGHVPGSGDSF